jgi:hypothetical protein
MESFQTRESVTLAKSGRELVVAVLKSANGFLDGQELANESLEGFWKTQKSAL